MQDEYGGLDVLKVAEVPVPQPGPGEVLVKVRAASINEWDQGLMRGTPLVNRTSGLRRPRRRTLGSDIAGVVEAVGGSVTRFRPGDAVFGDLSGCGFGAFAQYACAPESALTAKPGFLTFEQAAAVPQAGGLAMAGLEKGGPLRPGQRVLVNGGGGGVGTFAIQIAKASGVEVTGVDGPGKLDVMRELGADRVIDFTSEDFTRSGEQYDLILDVVCRRSVARLPARAAPGRHVWRRRWEHRAAGRGGRAGPGPATVRRPARQPGDVPGQPTRRDGQVGSPDGRGLGEAGDRSGVPTGRGSRRHGPLPQRIVRRQDRHHDVKQTPDVRKRSVVRGLVPSRAWPTAAGP